MKNSFGWNREDDQPVIVLHRTPFPYSLIENTHDLLCCVTGHRSCMWIGRWVDVWGLLYRKSERFVIPVDDADYAEFRMWMGVHYADDEKGSE